MAAPVVDPLPTAPIRSMTAPAFVAAANAWVSALATFVTQVNALGTWFATQLLLAFSGTAANSTLIGTGAKSFTGLTGLALAVGSFVIVARTSAPSNYMFGQVTAYNPTTGALTVSISSVGGAGTFTDWTVSLSSPNGAYAAASINFAIAMAASL